jgi:hypothetical protein
MLIYVNTAVLAFGLAGFAAAGAISMLMQVPAAPAHQTPTAQVQFPAPRPRLLLLRLQYLVAHARPAIQ